MTNSAKNDSDTYECPKCPTSRNNNNYRNRDRSVNESDTAPPNQSQGGSHAPNPGASGASTHFCLDFSGPLLSDEPQQVHIGPRTLGDIVRDLNEVGACIASAATDTSGKPRIATLHIPGRATHVLDVATVGDISPVRAALSNIQMAGFGSSLPPEFGLSHFWDGQLATEVLFAGQIPRQPTLEDAFSRLGMKSPSFAGVSEFPKADEIRGAVQAVIATVRFFERLEVGIREQGLEKTVRLDMEARRVLDDMSITGIRVDANGWTKLCDKKCEDVTRLLEAIRLNLGIEHPHDDDEVFHQIAKRGVRLNSTSTAELRSHVGVPGIKELIEWRKAQAFVNDAGKNVLAALERSTDGRVHPTWNVLGTVTGRTTSSEPNLLGIAKDYRLNFLPADGNVFVHGDIAAAQLRILAEVTGDETLTNVFINEEDPHAMTASSFSASGVPIGRDDAKPINFGVPFGMTAGGLVEYASEFGVDFTEAGAASYITNYRATYPGVARWQDEVESSPTSQTRSIGGRTRCYAPGDRDFRSRLASPIQGTEADALKRALLHLARELPRYDGRLVLVLYDAVLVECPKGVAEEVRSLVESCLREGLEHFLRTVPVVVKTDVRRTWRG